MIDATNAERVVTHPALASDLQTLCWGSTGVCGIVAAVIQGPVVDAWGARTLYARVEEARGGQCKRRLRCRPRALDLLVLGPRA